MDSPPSPVIPAPSAPSTVSDLESVVEVNPRFRDKETPESHLVDSENMNVSTRPIIPDCDGKPLFDTGDGDIEFWVNDACFETHKYLVKRFAGLRDLLLDQPPSKALRVHTDRCDTEDFRCMFKVLYASIIEGPSKFDSTTLVSALRIATVYDYPTLRAYSVKQLEHAELTAIERIKIAREFGLESWEEPAYLELCERDEAITTQEAGVLGLGAFVHVAGIREREQRRRGKEDAQATALPSFPSSINTTQSQTNAFGGTFAGFGSGTRAGAFGNTSGTAGGFGTAVTPTGTAAGGVFAAAKPAGNIFGSTTTAAPTPGATNTTNPPTSSPFGQPQQNQPQQQTTIFGQLAQPATQSTGLFGQNIQTASAFGQPASNATSAGPFGQSGTKTGSGLFGQPAQQQQGTTSAFCLTTTNTTNASKGGKKKRGSKPTIAGAFGTTTTQPAATKSDTFNALGQNNQAGQTTSIFGQPQQNQQHPASTDSGSGSGTTNTAKKPSFFGQQPAQPTTSTFDLSGQKSKGSAESALRPESKTSSPSSHSESACDKQGEASDTRAQAVGSAQNSDIKMNPSFINTRLDHDYACSEWTSSSGSEYQLKITDCNCRFLDKSGAVQSESSCLITPCSAKAFRALQTQQLAHARSIATLESTVKEITAAPSSAAKPAQDSTTSSTIQAEVRLMLGTLRKPRTGAWS